MQNGPSDFFKRWSMGQKRLRTSDGNEGRCQKTKLLV